MFRLGWCLALAVGCSGSGATDGPTTTAPTDTGTAPSAAVSATARNSDLVANVFHVAFVSAADGVGFVEFGLDGAFDRRTPDVPSGAPREVPLLGLKSGRTYAARAVVVDGSGARHESEPMTVEVPPAPDDLPSFVIDTRTAEAAGGYRALSVLGPVRHFLGIVDADGDWVWWMSVDRTQLVTQLAPSWDGTSLLWLEYPGNEEEQPGKVRRVRLDGDGAPVDLSVRTGHHAFVEHEDGAIAWLGADWRVTDIDGVGSGLVLTDRLYEQHPDEADPTARFDFFDDFPQEPARICEHSDEPVELALGTAFEWTHSNSLMFVPSLDSWLLNSKKADWLVRIDRATGAVVWVLHGPDGDFTGPSGEDLWPDADRFGLWSHGHLSEAWDGGLLMFDNGDHRDPPVSSVAEVHWDDTTFTAERVWEFVHPEGGYSVALGDARRMPNGNLLTAWGQLGELMEVTPDRRVVWRAHDPERRLLGRIRYLDDLYALPAPY